MNSVSDIPQELMSKMRESFETEPKIRELRVQQQMLMRTGKYDDALALARQIDVFPYSKDTHEALVQVHIAVSCSHCLLCAQSLIRHGEDSR